MLDASLMRWGQPTVVSFQIKYLSEWMEMNGRL